jgi:hypothetical protein
MPPEDKKPKSNFQYGYEFEGSDDDDSTSPNGKPSYYSAQTNSYAGDKLFTIGKQKPDFSKIEENKRQAEQAEKTYTSFKGKNQKDSAVTKKKKQKDKDKESNAFSIANQNKYLYDDDMGEVAEWAGKTLNTKAKPRIDSDEEQDSEAYEDDDNRQQGFDAEFDDVWDTSKPSKPNGDAQDTYHAEQKKKTEALAKKYGLDSGNKPDHKSAPQKAAPQIGKISSQLGQRYGLVTNKLQEKSKQMGAVDLPEVDSYKDLGKKTKISEDKLPNLFPDKKKTGGEDTPAMLIAKAKQKAPEQQTFSIAANKDKLYEDAKGNAEKNDSSGSEVEANSGSFDFGDDADLSKDGSWNDATNQNLQQIKVNQKDLVIQKIKQ